MNARVSDTHKTHPQTITLHHLPLHQNSFPSRDGGLPYELRALEAVLATVARRLEEDAAALDSDAAPALEALGAGKRKKERERCVCVLPLVFSAF